MVKNIDIFKDGHFYKCFAYDFREREHAFNLIYERNLILFHNPLFQAVDARFN